MTLRFSDLNPLGRAIIIVVTALTFGVAAVSFATSYGALYAWVRDTGLYSDRLTHLWPLLLDGAFIVAQLAAILAGILRGSRAWPILTMLLTGALTVWFNLQHAGSDPGRRLAAALPPVLMMLAFEIDIQIVRWVMRALGKPMGPITPPPPADVSASRLGPVPGLVYRADGLPVWNGPTPTPPDFWPPEAYGQIPSPTYSEYPQNGQAGLNGDGAGLTKRQHVEAYLDRLTSEQLASITARQVAAELTAHGVQVTERWVKPILDQHQPTPRGAAAPRRRGSGTRPPRPRR